MHIIDLKKKFSIDNLDEKLVFGYEKKIRKRHGSLRPSIIRGLLIGPSNCRKTSVMISLLTCSLGLGFENIYIYSKSLHQPKYEYLRKILAPIKGLGYYAFSDLSNIAEPADANANSVFIFDDVICVKKML